MTDHRKIRRDGSVFLVVSDGGHGAVTLEAWTDPDGAPHGVLVLHYPGALTSRQESGPCEFVPGGRCYPDPSYTAGHELAADVLAGYDGRAWTELYQYLSTCMIPG